jgi:two-component system, LytTR family, response regulator
MAKIKAIIIDDEDRARNSLSLLVKEYCEQVEIIDSCSNVPEGVISINKNRPDLVFLDIEMPEYNGFELLSFFREVDFQIIFVTAYNDYALRAFEVSAIDYLLKPVDIDKLKNAVEKVVQRTQNSELENRIEILSEALKTKEFNKIALPMQDGMSFVLTSDIVYLEADGSYTEVWLKNGSKILVSKKLKFFEDVLSDKSNFFRSHRSFIVNINYIDKYSKSDSGLVLENGKNIIISRERKFEFEQILKENGIWVG